MRKLCLFYRTVRKTDSNPNSTTRLSLDRSEFCFFLLSLFFPHTFFFSFSLFFFDFFSFFPLFFCPSFQDKLDKMQIGSNEDVNDLNYDCDNELWVARGGN